MTIILSRHSNQFGYFLKTVVFNERKKLINYAINHATIPEVIKQRTTSRTIDARKNIINEKIQILNHQILTHNWIEKVQLETVIDFIDSNQSCNVDQMHLLLQWCNNVMDCLPIDKVKLMESIWFKLTLFEYKIKLKHYHAILTVYLENNYDFSINNLLMEMKESEIYLKCKTADMCIKYYCTRGEIDKALLFWKHHRNTVVFPSLNAFYSSLLTSCSQLGNKECAKDIINDMINKNINVSTESYTNIMCIHAKLNEIKEIKNIINNCHSINMYFVNSNILKVIYTLALNKHTNHIYVMYEYLIKTLHISDKELQFILELINIDQLDVALDVFLHMSLSNNEYLQYETVKIILKRVIDKNMKCDKVMQVCKLLKNNREVYKKLLLSSLYYSLSKNDELSLSLLRQCKFYCTIKPHYFWPLFYRRVMQYDFQGILNILNIMMNEFSVSPCVYTLAEYILPFNLGRHHYMKSLLLTYNLSETIVNNAWVLLYIRKNQLEKAAAYMEGNEGKYFYDILAHDLRKALVNSNAIDDFVKISCKLVRKKEGTKDSTKFSNNNFEFVPVSKHIHDVMIDCSDNSRWTSKIFHGLSYKHLNPTHETIRTEYDYINKQKEQFVVKGR